MDKYRFFAIVCVVLLHALPDTHCTRQGRQNEEGATTVTTEATPAPTTNPPPMSSDTPSTSAPAPQTTAAPTNPSSTTAQTTETSMTNNDEKGTDVILKSLMQIGTALKTIISIVALPLALIAIVVAVGVFVLRSGYLNVEGSVDTDAGPYAYGKPGNGYPSEGEYLPYSAGAADKLDQVFDFFDAHHPVSASYSGSSAQSHGDFLAQRKRR